MTMLKVWVRPGRPSIKIPSVRISASAPVFPTIANLKLRLESDLGVTTEGAQRVIEWDDQVAAVPYLATTLTNLRPTLVANQIGSLPAVRFDGVGNQLHTAAALLASLITANSHFVIAVVKNNSAVAHSALAYLNPGIFVATGGNWIGLSGDSTRISSGTDPGGEPPASIVQATGALIYTESILTAAAGGTIALKVGTGGAPTSITGAGGFATTGTLVIGTNYNAATLWAGDLFALYVGTSITGPELTALQAWINSKYGPGL